MTKQSNWTGERLETFIYNETTIEHLHRYAFAMQFARGKSVLDIASGEGYGSNLMATVADRVTGVDIDDETIQKAKGRYVKNNLEYRLGSASKIPVEDQVIDLVVSFETIEHHEQHDEMMLEIKRVLKPGGLLIISTPDKLYYSDKLNFKNPYHVKELYVDEFKSLIKNYFSKTDFIYQKAMLGSLFLPEVNRGSQYEFKGNYDSIRASDELAAMFIIAVASDGDLPVFGVSIFNDPDMVTNAVNGIAEDIKKSKSYRLGNILLAPLRLFRKLR